MTKRQTSKVRRSPGRVLKVRVISPRIAWFGFVKFLSGLGRLTLVLALLSLAAWGVWEGVQRALYQNPDFRLKLIDLNENPAVDAAMLVEVANINLDGSLFDVDVEALTATLNALPQVASAHAERHLPDRLVVRVTAREARARIVCEEAGFPAEISQDTLLVDVDGHAYLCRTGALNIAAQLPAVHLRATEDVPVRPGIRLHHPDLQHAFNLLDAACNEDPAALQWIESIERTKEWALTLRTRGGTSATFGTGDHARQFSNLRSALDHASEQGYRISTINLIPRENIPITILEPLEAPPRAIAVPEEIEEFKEFEEFEAPPQAIAVPEPSPDSPLEDRRARDLNSLLNRD
jgi:hypothetical protein